MALRADEVSLPERDPADLRALVRLAKAGDADAFGQVFLELYPRVLRLAQLRLAAAAAEDAAAETFLRAWSGLARYRETPAPFAAWVYGIARHVVADAQRRERRSAMTTPRDLASEDFTPGSDTRVRLGAALASLPDEQRCVLELKFFMGLSNDQVARALGKSAGAVNTQQWRALANMRRALEGS